jgi:hypothetical protein
MKKILLSFLIFFAVISTLFSQEFLRKNPNYVDTATFMIWASPKFAVQFPFGRKGYLSSTFGYNYDVGLDLSIKTKSNWTFDVAFDYMFGSKIKKNAEQILGDMCFIVDVLVDGVLRHVPVILNGAGNNSVTLNYEGRYWYFGSSVGKIIPLNRWKNSGLWFKFSAGYFGHKIHFLDSYHLFPQIKQNTYRLGYDQRSSAIALNQFFGYLFMQKRRTLSFYVGVEFWEIFSKPDRGYIFAGDLAGNTDDLKRRFSGLVGIKIAWILPFYEKTRVTTYYYH